MSQLPPLNALRAFEVVARHLSFKVAADELCVTPGAVSRQVQNLELFLGIKLFIRSNRQITLTPRGEIYRRDVCDALERVARATSAIGASANERVLRLKLPPTCAVRWLVPRLAHFHALHPHIRVQVATSHEEVEFDRDDVDAAVHYGTGPAKGLVGERLFGEVLLPVCSPAVLRSAATPRELAGQILLHSARRPDDWPRWFTAAGVNDVPIEQQIVLENSSLTYQAAISGLGIAIAQAAFVVDRLGAGELVSPVDTPLRTEMGYHLVFPRERLRQTKLRQFRAWMTHEAAITRRQGLPGM